MSISIQTTMRKGCLKEKKSSPITIMWVKKRARWFGVLAQVNGRTAILFLKKYFVSAARRIRADMLELAVPEIGMLSVVREI